MRNNILLILGMLSLCLFSFSTKEEKCPPLPIKIHKYATVSNQGETKLIYKPDNVHLSLVEGCVFWDRKNIDCDIKTLAYIKTYYEGQVDPGTLEAVAIENLKNQ